MAQSDHSLMYPVNPRQLQEVSRAYSNPRQVRSPSSAQIRKRIKIASKDAQKQPPSIKPDQERLMEEGLSLKMENNSYREENIRLKTRINQLDREIAKRDEFLDELRSKAGEKHYYVALKQGHLVSSLKQAVKELRFELKSREDELAKLRKTVKFTNISEIEAEMEAYIEECNRLKRLLLESARPVSRGRMVNSIDQAQGQIITKLNKEKLELEKNLQSLQEELSRAKQREKTPVKEQKDASELQAEISKVREDLTTKGKMVSQAEEKIRQQAAILKETQEQLYAVTRERDTFRRRHNEAIETLHEVQSRLSVIESHEIQSTLHFFVNKLASKKLSFLQLLQSFPDPASFQDLVQRVEEAHVVVPEQYWSALCKYYINDQGAVDFRRLIADVEPIKPKVRDSALMFFAKKSVKKEHTESSAVQETAKTFSSRGDLSAENGFEKEELESEDEEQSESAGDSRANHSDIGTKRDLQDESESARYPPAQDSEEFREEEPEEILSKRESFTKKQNLQVEVVEYNPIESLESEKRELDSSAEERYESEHSSEDLQHEENPSVFEDQELVSERKIASERKAYHDLDRDLLHSESSKHDDSLIQPNEPSESIESKSAKDKSEKHSQVSSPKSQTVFSRKESKISKESQDESKLSAAPIDFSKGYESSSQKESKASTPKAIQFLSPKPSDSSSFRVSKPESKATSPKSEVRSKDKESGRVASSRKLSESSSRKHSESSSRKDSERSRQSLVPDIPPQAPTQVADIDEKPQAVPDFHKSDSEDEVKSDSKQSEEAISEQHEEYKEDWGEADGGNTGKRSQSESESEEAFFEPQEESPEIFSYPFSVRDTEPAEDTGIAFQPKLSNVLTSNEMDEDCPVAAFFPEEEQLPEPLAIEEPLTVEPLGSVFDTFNEEFIAKEEQLPEGIKSAPEDEGQQSIGEENEYQAEEEVSEDRANEFTPQVEESVHSEEDKSLQEEQESKSSDSPKVIPDRSDSSSSKHEPESPHINSVPVQSYPPPVSSPMHDSLHRSSTPESMLEEQHSDCHQPIDLDPTPPHIATDFQQSQELEDTEKLAEAQSEYMEHPPEDDRSRPQDADEMEQSHHSEQSPPLEPSPRNNETATAHHEPEFFAAPDSPRPPSEPQQTDQFHPVLKDESSKGPIVDYQSLEGEKDHSSDSESKHAAPALVPLPPPAIDPRTPSESSHPSSTADPIIARTRDNIELIATALKSREQSVREAFEDFNGWVSTADFLYGLRALGLSDFPPDEFQLIVMSLSGNESGDMEIEELERLFAVHGVVARRRAASHVSEPDEIETDLKEELARPDRAEKQSSPMSGSVRVTANPFSATGSVIEAIQAVGEQPPVNEIEAQEVMTSEAEERQSCSNSDSFYEYAGEGSSRAQSHR